jgi:hypothetical protein
MPPPNSPARAEKCPDCGGANIERGYCSDVELDYDLLNADVSWIVCKDCREADVSLGKTATWRPETPTAYVEQRACGNCYYFDGARCSQNFQRIPRKPWGLCPHHEPEEGRDE